jgi:hypothetical protein
VPLDQAFKGVSDYFGERVVFVVEANHSCDCAQAEIFHYQIEWHEVCMASA